MSRRNVQTYGVDDDVDRDGNEAKEKREIELAEQSEFSGADRSMKRKSFISSISPGSGWPAISVLKGLVGWELEKLRGSDRDHESNDCDHEVGVPPLHHGDQLVGHRRHEHDSETHTR